MTMAYYKQILNDVNIFVGKHYVNKPDFSGVLPFMGTFFFK